MVNICVRVLNTEDVTCECSDFGAACINLLKVMFQTF